MAPKGIRVIVADDQPVVVEGVLSRLAQQQDMHVVGSANNFTQLLDLLQQVIAEVVVLDLQGMGAGPLTMVKRLHRDYPRLAIVVFSSTYMYAYELVEAGIYGYLMKEELTSLLVQAIQGAVRHELTLSPSVTDYLNRSEFVKSHTNLSDREHSVMQLLAKGYTNEAIADQLGIDLRTVHNYLATLRRKTGIFQRSELISWYRKMLAQEPKEAG